MASATRTFSEIAQALDLMPEQARSRHHRVRRLVRRLWERCSEMASWDSFAGVLGAENFSSLARNAAPGDSEYE
ncbi:MAG: hypothetical protein IRY99_20800 [Isosphaeraceae bacterium]|nr:hypothetical protein [Isosphaeraceae bacterium]